MEALSKLFTETSNDALRAIIIVGILMAFLIPTYIKASEKRRKQDREEKKLLIDVIAENAKASTKLSTLLENNNRACDTCKFEQTILYEKLHDKVDKTDETLTEIKWYIMGGNDKLNEPKEGGHKNEKSNKD